MTNHTAQHNPTRISQRKISALLERDRGRDEIQVSSTVSLPEKFCLGPGHYSGWKSKEGNLSGSDESEYPEISEFINLKTKSI